MVLLDQDQHLLGEYFHNSRWLVLVDKRKFFGRYPQWQWSPLPSIKWSWFHLVYRHWNTYAIKKVGILDTEEDSPASKDWQWCGRVLNLQTTLLHCSPPNCVTLVKWSNIFGLWFLIKGGHTRWPLRSLPVPFYDWPHCANISWPFSELKSVPKSYLEWNVPLFWITSQGRYNQHFSRARSKLVSTYIQVSFGCPFSPSSAALATQCQGESWGRRVV